MIPEDIFIAACLCVAILAMGVAASPRYAARISGTIQGLASRVVGWG